MPQLRAVRWWGSGLCAAALPGLAAWSARSPWSLAHTSGFALPVGPDPGLWGMAALLARTDAPQTVPPLFPRLLAWTEGGHGLVNAALWVNAWSFGLAIIAAGLAAAALTRTRWMALGAAVAAAALVATVLPVAPSIWYLQPDLLTLGLLTLSALSAVWWVRTGAGWAVVAHGVACGLVFQAREHGLVVLLGTLLVVPLVTRGRWTRRLAMTGLLLVGAQLAGAVVSGHPLDPFFMQHGMPHGTVTKALVALEHSLGLTLGHAPQMIDLPAELHGRPDNGVEAIGVLAERAAAVSWRYLPLVISTLVGLAGVLLAHRWRTALALAAVLSPLAAALLVWTEERHFLVLGGVMVVTTVGGLAAGLERWRPRVGAVGIAIVGVSVSVAVARHDPSLDRRIMADLVHKQEGEAPMIEAARWVRAHAEAGSVLMAPEKAAIIAGIPPVGKDPELIKLQEPPDWPALVYRFWAIDCGPLGAAWERVHGSGRWAVARVARPEDVDVRCLFGELRGPLMHHPPRGVPRPEPRPAPGCPSAATAR